MTVLDISNYDWPLNASCLKEEGVDRVIVGCQRAYIAEQQIGLLRGAGIVVTDLYAFLYFGFDPMAETEKAIGVAQRQGGIRTIWLDCESTGQYDRAGGPAQRVEELKGCVAAVENAGFRCGIYTGGWWWPTQQGMGESTTFSILPLWHSAYFDDEREVRQVNYGGWSKVAIHQYSSSIQVCGRERDHNHVFEQEEVDMALLDEVVAALGGIEAIREWNEKGNSLLLGYAQEQNDQVSLSHRIAACEGHLLNHPASGPSLPKGARLSVEVI